MFDSVGASDTRKWKWRLAGAVIACALILMAVWVVRTTQMPLRSFTGPLPPLTSEQTDLAQRLSVHVKYLTEVVGERNLSNPGSLETSAQYLRRYLEQVGYDVVQQSYSIEGRSVSNLEVTLPGAQKFSQVLIVGAHYDSVAGTSGADDNGTGIAALLELARMLRSSKPQRSVRLVLFVAEEPPFFRPATWAVWCMQGN